MFTNQLVGLESKGHAASPKIVKGKKNVCLSLFYLYAINKEFIRFHSAKGCSFSIFSCLHHLGDKPLSHINHLVRQITGNTKIRLVIDVASAREKLFSVFKAKAACYDDPRFSCVSISFTDTVNSLELNILCVFWYSTAPVSQRSWV